MQGSCLRASLGPCVGDADAVHEILRENSPRNRKVQAGTGTSKPAWWPRFVSKGLFLIA